MAVIALVPVIPVARHQIVVYAGLRLVHVLMDIGRTAVGGVHLLHIEDSLACRRHAVTLYSSLDVGHASGVAAVSRHAPHLRRTASVRDEVYTFGVGAPSGRRIVRRVVGEGLLLARRHVAQVDYGQTLVLGHVVTRDGVERLCAVGREQGFAHASHFPHHRRGETRLGDFVGGQRVVYVERSGRFFAAARHQCRKHHKQK